MVVIKLSKEIYRLFFLKNVKKMFERDKYQRQ